LFSVPVVINITTTAIFSTDIVLFCIITHCAGGIRVQHVEKMNQFSGPCRRRLGFARCSRTPANGRRVYLSPLGPRACSLVLLPLPFPPALDAELQERRFS